jgi:hypothetical protein
LGVPSERHLEENTAPMERKTDVIIGFYKDSAPLERGLIPEFTLK